MLTGKTTLIKMRFVDNGSPYQGKSICVALRF